MRHHCVNCGTELVVRVIEGRDVEACPNDDFVLWHDPKVTTAVVIDVDGSVLLGRRGIEPGRGLWCLPGGFVNDDEGPWESAARECAEEICCAVELTRLIGVYHIAKRGAASMIGIAYQASIIDGGRPSPGPEMLEVRAFPLASLPPLAFPSHQKVLVEYQQGVLASGGPTSLARLEASGPQSASVAARRGSRPSPAQAPSRPRRKS